MSPIIILVQPQIAQNIGKVARAMLNCGLKELRLVRPGANHCHPDALALAAGADEVLQKATLFETVPEAISDLHQLYSTSTRHRDKIELQLTPKKAAGLFVKAIARGQKLGILFGPERSGLTNEDMVLCRGNITIPSNPEFSSLNLAQAVLVLAYEWYQASCAAPSVTLKYGATTLATQGELWGFLTQLEQELDQVDYFHVAHKKPKMLRTLHNIFSRIPLAAQEVRTLRGVVSDLVAKKRRR